MRRRRWSSNHLGYTRFQRLDFVYEPFVGEFQLLQLVLPAGAATSLELFEYIGCVGLHDMCGRRAKGLDLVYELRRNGRL